MASGLPKVQGLVNDHITKAVQNGDIDEIVDAQGVLQYEKIAKALGKKRGSIKAAVDGLVQKIAAANGMTVEEAKAQLRKRQRTTEVSDYDNLGLSPAMQRSTVDDADLFGTNSDRGGSGEQTMEIVSSVGQTNANPFSDSMGAGNEEGTAFLEAAGVTDARGAVSVQETPDAYAEKRAAEAELRRVQELKALRELLSEADATLAEVNWNLTVRDPKNNLRAPAFADLHVADQVDFTFVSKAYENGDIDDAALVAEIRAMLSSLEKINASTDGAQGGESLLSGGNQKQLGEARQGERGGGPREVVAEGGTGPVLEGPGAVGNVSGAANPTEARVAALRARGLTDQQTERLDRIVSRYASGDIDLGRVVDELDTFEQALAFNPTSTAPAQAAPAPVVAKKAKRTDDKTAAASDGLKFSKADGTDQNASVESVRSAIDLVLTKAGRNNVVVAQTEQELVGAGVISAADALGVQGFVNTDGKAYFIAENIPRGYEVAVVLHEVGAHLGLERILTAEQFQALVGRIKTWARRGQDTLEGRVAAAAMARVKAAEVTELDASAELVAYFVEEAVKAGVNPTAMEARSELGRWFRTLWSAFKAALSKLNLVDTSKLSAQNVVDLAYGAANRTLVEPLVQGTSPFQEIVAGRSKDATIPLHMRGKRRMSPNAPGAPVEKGALPNATEAEVLAFYKKGQGVDPTASFGGDSFGYPGQEYFSWGASAEFGPYKHIATNGYWDGEVLDVTLFQHQLVHAVTQELEAAGILSDTAIIKDAGMLHIQAWPVNKRDNVWEIGLTGPTEGSSAFAYAQAHGGVSVVASPDPLDVDGYTRLEGVPWAAVLGVMSEVRRRITRLQGGRVPNVVFRRDTGALVGKRSAYPSDAVRRRFSKNPTPTGMFDTLKNMVASTDVFVNTVGHARAARNKSLTLEQLAEVAESPEVDAYRRAMVAMQTDSKERVNAAAKIDFEWAKLYDKDSWFGFGKKADNSQANKLSEVMRAATRAQFDPDKNEAPTTEEQRDIAALWDGLSEDARKVYRQVREFYEDSFKERKAILMKAAEAAKKSGANTREVERMFAKMKGPYFPLMRLGGYYSVGMSSELAGLVAKQAEGTATAAELKRIELLRKDKNHYATSGHQTRAEAKWASDEFRKKMGYGHFNEVEKKIASEVSSIPDMAKIEAHIAADLPADMRQHVKDMLAQMYFDLLPARHALKQSMMREGVHGEETNMRRVFATSAVAQAHHISRLKHTSTLSEKLLAVKVAGRTDDKLRNVYNTLVQHSALALEQDQENRFVNGIMQVSYLANLGLSPAFLITNLTQVPMVTLPWLSARFGTGAATRALWTSFADVAKMMGATYGKGDFLKGGWRSEFNWSSMFPAGSGVDKMYTEMLNRNLLDITMEHDLGVVAEMRSSTLDNTLKVINTPVRLTELANRALTALTAYRLSLARDNNHERAVEMAAQALSKTQLDYSYLNAPYFMKSMFGSKSAARIMMQFRKFQQGMLYLVLKSAVDSFGATGKTEAETKRLRSEARKTLGGLFLTTGVMAGAVGMPMMGTVLMALTLAGGDDDEPFDAEVALRNYVADRLGKEYADAIVKGLPQLLGVDMGRVGMGGLLNPVPIVQRADGDKQQAMNYFSAFVGGAPASTAFNIYEGLIMMANGDVAKGAEKVVPLKAAQNLIRAARYESEGMTDRNGNTVLPADRFDAADLVLRGMGFQTTLEENYYAATSAVQNAKDRLTKRRAKLLNAYVQARLAGEPVDEIEIEIEIARFNEKNPERGLRIDHATKLRSLEARRRLLAERNESGLSTSKANEPYLDRARFATS